MATPKEKLPASGALGRRMSTNPASPTTSRPSTRSPTPSSAASSTNGGLARTRSLRGSALTNNRRSITAPSGLTLSAQAAEAAEAEEELRAKQFAAMEEMREKLKLSESKAENFEKEVEVLHLRLEEAHAEQQKLEDRLHEETERVEMLSNEKREAARQMREMESIYEAERAAMNKEKEEMSNREEEMRDVIQRLKDSLSQKQNGDDELREVRGDSRNFRHSNNSSPRSTPQLGANDSQFAPPSSVNRSDSRNNSKLLLSKDRVIEGLRLELAEAQIKIAESENMGGTRLQEVERLLLEARMNNARLMEDNESFQLLLSEKTLNGDFAKLNDFGYTDHLDASPARSSALDALEGRPSGGNAMSSLADELSGASVDDDETFRRLEAELKASKEQNKALTLYINKIIERLLEHQGFEAILANDTSAPAKSANTDKDLPPPPPSKDMPPPAQSQAPSILQRAKSVVAGGNRSKPRPMSQMPAAHSALTDPDTAPSIPFNLNRSASVATRKARPQSLNATTNGAGAYNVVSQMYKGQNPTSPLNGPQTPRNSSFFAPRETGGNPNAAARAPSQSFSGNNIERPGRQSGFSDSGSMHSSETGITSHTGEVSTPPGSVRDGSSIKDGIGASPPRESRTATFAGNKPRPLRLVQDAAREEKEEAERMAREKSEKRGTWYGWAMSAVAQKKKDDEANNGGEVMSGKD